MANYKGRQTKAIEAVQWKDKKISEVTSWVSEALYKDPGRVGGLIRMGDEVQLLTDTGRHTVKDGDYIVRLESGKLIICLEGVFEELFTPEVTIPEGTDERMNIIGQNGNTGEHYEAEELTDEFTDKELRWIKRKAKDYYEKAIGIPLMTKLLDIERKCKLKINEKH